MATSAAGDQPGRSVLLLDMAKDIRQQVPEALLVMAPVQKREVRHDEEEVVAVPRRVHKREGAAGKLGEGGS